MSGYTTTTPSPRQNWSATGHPDNRSAAADPVRPVRDSSLVTRDVALSSSSSSYVVWRISSTPHYTFQYHHGRCKQANESFTQYANDYTISYNYIYIVSQKIGTPRFYHNWKSKLPLATLARLQDKCDSLYDICFKTKFFQPIQRSTYFFPVPLA